MASTTDEQQKMELYRLQVHLSTGNTVTSHTDEGTAHKVVDEWLDYKSSPNISGEEKTISWKGISDTADRAGQRFAIEASAIVSVIVDYAYDIPKPMEF